MFSTKFGEYMEWKEPGMSYKLGYGGLDGIQALKCI